MSLIEDDNSPYKAFHLDAIADAVIGLDASDALMISAKTGVGVPEVLEAIVHRLPAPKGDEAAPLKALLVDAWYDPYLGVVILVLLALPPILTNTYVGVRQVDRDTVDSARGIPNLYLTESADGGPRPSVREQRDDEDGGEAGDGRDDRRRP